MHTVGSNSWLLTVKFADASAAIKATEIAIIAEGFESGPPQSESERTQEGESEHGHATSNQGRPNAKADR